MSRGRISLAVAGTLALGLLVLQARAPSLSAAEPPCEFDGIERIVAVGDVHGAYDRFVEILGAAGVLNAGAHWAGGRTHLVQTGDVLDRGPDSRKVLDLLERLQNEARKAGGAVHPLLGNHEAMRMLGDLRYVVPGEYQAFETPRSVSMRDEFLKSAEPFQRPADVPLGWVEMRQAFGRTGEYGRWLRTLNVVIKIDGVLFLHGGISPGLADMSCETINAAIRREITTDIEKTRAAPRTSLSAREDGPLWYRGLALEPDSFGPAVEEILQKQHARAIVTSHTVAPRGRIRVRFDGKVMQIDTGMQPAHVADGQASALEIEHGVFTAIYRDHRDVLPGPPQVAEKPGTLK